MVTVALQLPESEARGIPNGRLTDKFPSSTTLWLVLRKFEAGVAGNGSTRNLTSRGVPVAAVGNGAGRLFYEIPVIQALGRELSTFTDLQKSLAQLGFNSGSILLRLSFRRTEEPLEEAMVKIDDYFKSADDATTPKPQEQPVTEQAPADIPNELAQPSTSTDETAPIAPVFSEQPAETPIRTAIPTEQSSASPPSSRPITVFSPSTSNTPLSAQTAYNENDYIPSIEHARSYQHRLNQASRPNRLPTDAEIAAKATVEEQKLAGIKEIDVKIRLPDQSQIVSKFGQQDTGKTLYDFARNCMTEPFASAKFLLTFPSPGAPAFGGNKMQNVIPDSEKVFLIKNLGMTGRMLVNFSWDATASLPARQSRASVLKPELRSQAQQHRVQQPADIAEEPVAAESGGPAQGGGQKPSTRKPGQLPKWLRLPGKK